MATAYTIPTRLARVSRVSNNASDARRRVLNLYRNWYRSAPEIISSYSLNISPAYFRHLIRQKFEHNRHVSDPRAIDILITKNQQEYQETMNIWKQPDHVLGILLQTPKELGRESRGFLERFYEGRDEDAVVPAASGVH